MNRKQPRLLVITDKSDLAETQLIIGLASAGVAVTVLANATGKNFHLFTSAGIAGPSLALTGRFDSAGTAVIRNELQTHRYDVIYAFNPRALACALRASKGMNVGIMVYRGVIGNIGLWHPESWITFLNPRLNRIVCVSDAVKRYIESICIFGRPVLKKKAVRIYKGHHPAWYEQAPAKLAKLGIPEDAFVLCCIGRDRPGKGFSTLIDAMNLIPDTCPVYLLLVGDLSGNNELKTKVKASRHRDRIVFTGYRKDAPRIAGACSALVLPSESEGLPRVVIEAMVHGRPVIVTEAGGMPELVNDGVEGYIVPVRAPKALARAIMALAENPQQAENMGQRGYNRILHGFSVEQSVAETRELLCEVTDEIAHAQTTRR